MARSMFDPIHDGIGRTEVIAILCVIFILFGRHLPPVMRSLVRRPWE